MRQLKAAQALSRRMEMTSRWVSSTRIAGIWDGSLQACWQQSQEEVIVGEGKPIPGHPKAVPAHKSPRAKSPRSPGGALDFSKSPRSPGAECSKSPISDIVGLPDEDLRKLKISLLSSSPEKWVVTYEFLIPYFTNWIHISNWHPSAGRWALCRQGRPRSSFQMKIMSQSILMIRLEGQKHNAWFPINWSKRVKTHKYDTMIWYYNN